MVDRYCGTDDVKTYFNWSSLDTTTCPTLAQVTEWITSSEEEIDEKTSKTWEQSVRQDRLIPTSTTRDFFLPVKPLVSVSAIEYNTGTEWSPTWTAIPGTYRIVSLDNAHIRTETFFDQANELRFSYIAGFSSVPSNIKELCVKLVERRMLNWKLANTFQETEVMSVASLRVQDRSKENINYRMVVLDADIKGLFDKLGKGLMAKNVDFGMAWY